MHLTTQNGRVVQRGDRIIVARNDSWRSESNYGQWFIAVETPAANYDSPHDPILFMPRTGYTSGCDAHKAKSEELRRFAEAIAEMIRASLEAQA